MGGFNVGQSVLESLNQALAISEYTAGAHYHKRLSPELQTMSRDAAMSRAVSGLAASPRQPSSGWRV